MIRLATYADIPTIIEIGQNVIDRSKTYNVQVDPKQTAYMIRRAINDKKMDVFIAQKADQVVGFLIALKDEYWFAKTIDELFVFIDENIKEEPFEKVLEFNETYGYPEYIYFNREEMLVDEEMGYTISSFNID